MKTIVFVSHSAKSSADLAVLDRIVARLADEGLDPWVDRERLKTGVFWNQEITSALQRCHAAVILLSKTALDSAFVKYEVSVLTHRKRTQSSFELFPVIIDETSLDILEKDFYGAIRLNDLQAGRLADKEEAVFADLKTLDPEATKPTSAIEGALMQVFRQVAPEVLRKAAQDMKWPTWEAFELKDAEALSFVRQLLSVSLQKQISALRRIVEDLPAGYDFERVFKRIAPWWVDEGAARSLTAIQRGAPGRRCAVLNATYGRWTCEMFLRRAEPSEEAFILDAPDGGAATGAVPGSLPRHPGANPLVGAVVPVGRRAGADLVVQVRRGLLLKYLPNQGDESPAFDAQIDTAIANGESLHVFPVLIVHVDEHRLDALGELLDRFAHLTIVAATGENVSHVPASLAGRVTVIDPELSHDETTERHSEAYAFKWVTFKNQLLGRTG